MLQNGPLITLSRASEDISHGTTLAAVDPLQPLIYPAAMFSPSVRVRHRTGPLVLLGLALLCVARTSGSQHIRSSGGVIEAPEERAVFATPQRGDGQTLAAAKALFDTASVRLAREDLSGAEPLLKEAVEIQRSLAPDSIDLARSLTALGNVVRARFDLTAAAPLLREAVGILERLAPDTVDHAVSLNNLGNLRWRQSAYDEAAALFTRALAILERTQPSSTDAANSLMGIGITHYYRGRLGEAESYFHRALALEQRLSSGTGREARVLNNIGGVMSNRGNLLAAEGFYRRALAIHERVAPESHDVASTLHNIGITYYERGDRDRAEDYLQRALVLKERLERGGLNSASTLESLGNLARVRGDPAAAAAFLERALEIRERQAPRSLGVATVLLNLGNVSMDRGDLSTARERYESARSIIEPLAPARMEMAMLLDRFIELAERRGDHARDLDRLAADALTIFERVAPNSAVHAYALRRVGRLARNRGELDRAARAYSQALDAVEAQSQRLGGSFEVRTAFAGQRRAMYLEYIDLLMTLGQPTRAFEVLERSRARGLLMMLAERDLVLDRDLPADLQQTMRELRQDDDRLQASLAKLDPKSDADALERLRERQRELRAKRTQLVERVRATSPRLASLQYPQALELSQVQGALDRGTVMLSYQIGPDASRLFIVGPSGSATGESNLSVHTLAIGESGLRERVTALRRLIERDGEFKDADAAASTKAARQLFDLLIAPATPQIAAAERVLIVPDGPLHSLPFAALVQAERRVG